MKRAIITGATCGIGISLIKRLTENGMEVLALCRKDSKRNVNIPSSKLVTIKYCGLDELCDIVNDTGKEYDVFYHFGWNTARSRRNDFYSQCDNIRYAIDAVAAAAKFGCKTFIGAGSQAEYGRVEGTLLSSTPAFPENGYGIAKLAAGEFTREFAHSLGMKHVWGRIVSTYGPYEGGEGKSMITSVVTKMMAGEAMEFTKGEQMWDYLYNGDAAEAFALLGDRGIDGKVYVIGSGTARQLKDIIYEIADFFGTRGLVKLGALPYADKQVMYLKADVSELTKDTGWTPHTSLKEGVGEIVKHINCVL